MKVTEASNGLDPKASKLVGLVDLLRGMTKHTAGRRQVSKETFMKYAGLLGIMITPENLELMMQKEPLSNLFEPLDPQSRVLVFRGGEQETVGMPVDRARDVVAKMAKRANPLS